MTPLLEPLFGSKSSAGVLAYLCAHPQGYASEIARDIDMDVYAVQKQLEKFETCGLLHSRTDGRQRVYAFNPRHPLHAELKTLIEKAALLETNRAASGSARPLPEALREFFWDHDFEELSWESHRDLVTRRLLTDGSWEALAWLRNKLGDRDLRRWLIAQRGRGLSPRQLRYWSLVLRLPKRQVDEWARLAQSTSWSGR